LLPSDLGTTFAGNPDSGNFTGLTIPFRRISSTSVSTRQNDIIATVLHAEFHRGFSCQNFTVAISRYKIVAKRAGFSRMVGLPQEVAFGLRPPPNSPYEKMRSVVGTEH
jgi:hypothetical protein